MVVDDGSLVFKVHQGFGPSRASLMVARLTYQANTGWGE